jgi:copper(I)-binding protein
MSTLAPTRRAFISRSLGYSLAGGAIVLPLKQAASHSISKGTLEIVHPWTFEQQKSGVDAIVGMEIRNSGSNPDRIVAAECFDADMAEIKSSTMKGGKPVIEVPAKGGIDLFADGPHILLRTLKVSLTADTYINMVLLFERAGVVRIDVNIEERRS